MLTDKVALVTGSTSGIGLAIAQALASQGVHVMLHGRGDAAVIARTSAALAEATGVTVRTHDADVSRGPEVARLVADTEAAFGGIDILVNNAGIQHVAAVEVLPPDRWQAIQDVVLSAGFHAIHAALPGMRRRGWGRIINVSSAHGLVASPFKSAYVAAKHGVVGLTKAVALEVATDHITCNAICPGFVRTALVEGQIETLATAHGISRDDVLRDVVLAAQPTKRLIEVEEVAQLALYLCNDAARSITGAAIAIDGGWTAR